MNKLILNFFGEEVTVETPKTLQNLKQEISNKFCFSPSDAAEILVSYINDLKKTFIQTEQDFVDFVKKQIYKVDLDISPDSKLYKNSVLKLQEENDQNKKKLDELLKKKEALKKKKTTLVEERAKKIKEYENKIKLLKLKKYKLVKQTNKDKEKISCEINKTNKKIVELQKNLGLPVTIKENKKPTTAKTKPKAKIIKDKPKKITVVKKVTKPVKKVTKPVKKTEKKKVETKPKEEKEKDIFTKVNETINKMVENVTKTVSEQLNKKTKEVEVEKKKIEDSQIQLKEDEMKGFFDFNSVSKNVSEELNKWTKFVAAHTNELTKTLSQKYNNCVNAITSISNDENVNKKVNEKLRAPAPKKNGNKIHEGIKCHGCGKKPIVGNRFKCSICSNLDYCEKCEEQNKDLHLHPFIKIYSPEAAL